MKKLLIIALLTIVSTPMTFVSAQAFDFGKVIEKAVTGAAHDVIDETGDAAKAAATEAAAGDEEREQTQTSTSNDSASSTQQRAYKTGRGKAYK